MVKVHIGTNDAIRDAIAAVYESNPSSWMGPLYIGSCLDFFSLGILFSQVRFYYLKFPKDTIWIKQLVALIFVLSVAQTIVSFMTVWNMNVVAFGNWRFAGTISWSMCLAPIGQVLVSTVAQSFFVWRAFVLTGRNWYLLFALIALMLSVLACAIVYTLFLFVDPYYIPTALRVGTPMLVIGLAVDIIITAVVSYKLTKARGGLMLRTDKALSQMLSITWESAAPPVVSQALGIIIFFAAPTHSNWPPLLNMITPRLYAFSLLHSLNARVAVRSIITQGTSAWQAEGEQGLTSHQTQKKTTTGGLLVSPVASKSDQIAFNPAGTPLAQAQTTVVQSSPEPLGRESEDSGLALRSWPPL